MYQYGLKGVPGCGVRDQRRSPFITDQDIVCLGNELRGGGCGSQGCRVVERSSIASATVMNWARHQRVMTEATRKSMSGLYMEEMEERKGRPLSSHGAHAVL